MELKGFLALSELILEWKKGVLWEKLLSQTVCRFLGGSRRSPVISLASFNQFVLVCTVLDTDMTSNAVYFTVLVFAFNI